MLNPTRLEFARTRRGWTKTRLARELGVQPRSIQGYESNEYAPEQDKLEKISELLMFPIEFFYGGDVPLIAENTASFRSMSKMSATLKNTAFGMGSIAFMLNDWIEARFNLPEADLPDLSDLSPEDAAATLRRMWGLGEGPIRNLIHLLESRGVRVYSLAIEAKEVDAFSVWHKNCPFVFLNTFKSAEHSRFDAAHELGHLVRDRHSMLHGEVHSPEMEREANAFASAFLMPRQNVIAHKPVFPGIPQLINIKKYFGVSLAALAYRMNQLQLLTEWTYRNLCIQIAKKGYRTKEPEPMLPETSQVLAKVFSQLRQEGVGRVEVARQLDVFVTEIDNLTFGLTLSGVTSGGVSESKYTTSVSRVPLLQIVK
ncbi:XRE family transcriptional regulator [Limnobacter sp.]|jgi:Zn-dependent peptidase ImmA (M78 family)/DNA-binding XRE family transcriptional regulator|uniref:XRE family transcriptional regulator n=1 Tax=Limnobacter sp. TaxID=2003368 RepID=UPI00391C4A01